MKIDKNKLKELSELDDNSLWRQIRSIASGHGITLPETAPPHSELEKLRAILLSDKINPLTAMRMLNSIKRRQD